MAGERIALVEDDLDLSATLAGALEREGYATAVYRTGREGLEGILGTPPTWSSSTSTCPTSTACRCAASCAKPRRCATCRSSCSPPGSRSRTGSWASTSAPTTTSPSRSRCASSRAASAPCCGAAALDGGVPDDEYRDTRLEVRRGPMEVTLDGAEVRLTTRELELLWYLITNRPRVVSRERILERVWGLSSDVETRTIDVHIRALRAKLGAEIIETVIGAGYRFRGYP